MQKILKSKLPKPKGKVEKKPKYESFKLYIPNSPENKGFSWTLIVIIVFIIALVITLDKRFNFLNKSMSAIDLSSPVEFNPEDFLAPAPGTTTAPENGDNFVAPSSEQNNPSQISPSDEDFTTGEKSETSKSRKDGDFVIEGAQTSSNKSKNSSQFVGESSNSSNSGSSTNSSNFVTGSASSSSTSSDSSDFVTGQ